MNALTRTLTDGSLVLHERGTTCLMECLLQGVMSAVLSTSTGESYFYKVPQIAT